MPGTLNGLQKKNLFAGSKKSRIHLATLRIIRSFANMVKL